MYGSHRRFVLLCDNLPLTWPLKASENPYPDKTAQTRFEKGLLAKTAKQNGGDCLLYDQRVVCYKLESDVAIYVVGGLEENEVMLWTVLLALRDSLHLLFK